MKARKTILAPSAVVLGIALALRLLIGCAAEPGHRSTYEPTELGHYGNVPAGEQAAAGPSDIAFRRAVGY